MNGKGPRWFFSHRVRVIAGMVLTVVLLAWALRGMSPTLVWNVVKSARIEWLALGLVGMVTAFSLRAWRWGTLLWASYDPGPFHIRQSVVFVGLAANNMLPANLGEIVRASLLHRLRGIPLGVGIGSILAERLLDLVIVFTFLLLSLLGNLTNHAAVMDIERLHLGWLGAAILALGFGFVVAAHRPRWMIHLARIASRGIGLARFAARIEAGTSSLLGGLYFLKSPRLVVLALGQSLCMWGVIAFSYWAWMIAFGIAPIGWSAPLFVPAVAALAIGIPSVPGYFGPFEAALRFSLGIYGVPVNTIIAYTLTVHFLLVFALSVIGLGFALRLRLSWASVTQNTERTAEQSLGLSALGGGNPQKRLEGVICGESTIKENAARSVKNHECSQVRTA